MKKIISLITIISVIFCSLFICSNYVFADTTSNTSVSSAANTASTEAQITTTVNSSTSADQNILSTTNIINVLLIAIGAVLIILAFAIFIRMKD